MEYYESPIPDGRRLVIYEKMIKALREDHEDYCKDEMGYCKRPETKHVDCGRVLKGDKTYLSEITGPLHRVPLIPDPSLNMSCAQIHRRVRPKHPMHPLQLGGVAFARNVFTDYEYIEKQIQMSYHPENRYCFAVDENAKMDFFWKMAKLVYCFPNQMVLVPEPLSFDSAGHNQNLAHVKCMEILLRKFPKWSYLMLLQNHDIITKSVYELDRIFEIMGGANDVMTSKEKPRRRLKHLKWDPKSLKLFRNESLIPSKILNTPLTITMGGIEGSLSRAAVDWMINKVNLTTFLNQQNQTDYAGDEQFISTFQANSPLQMPGHFTIECSEKGIPVAAVTRMAQWSDGDPSKCLSRTSRHGACLFGIEDLKPMAELPYLVWNKAYPSFDWSIIECTAELLYNRTFLGQMDNKLDEDYYSNLVMVKYHKEHRNPGYKLNCTSSRKWRSYEEYL